MGVRCTLCRRYALTGTLRTDSRIARPCPPPAIRRCRFRLGRGRIRSYTPCHLPSTVLLSPVRDLVCASDRYLRIAGSALGAACVGCAGTPGGCYGRAPQRPGGTQAAWLRPVPAIRRYRGRCFSAEVVWRIPNQAGGVRTRKAIWHWRWSRAAASAQASGYSSGRASRIRRPSGRGTSCVDPRRT